MPRRRLHNPDADPLPASGLSEDVRDEQLKANSAFLRHHKEVRRFLDDRKAEDDYRQALREGYIEPDEPPQPKPEGWRPRHHVSSTEIAGFLVANLLRRPKIISNINAWLGGYELTRRVDPFDFPAFAVQKLGFLPKAQRKKEWRGNYSMKGIRHKVALKHDKLDPCIIVRLAGGKRLVTFFSGGLPDSTGHAEPGIIRDLVGRIDTWSHADLRHDVYAIAVPRSGAFRRAITRVRDAAGVTRIGVTWVTIERATGEVSGLDDVAGPLKTPRATSRRH